MGLVVELAIAKIIGALVLVFPFFGSNMKEWAYAGFGITLISAFVAHVSDGVVKVAVNIFIRAPQGIFISN
ncbi:MAG: DoxX family protein [Cytophagales bacterium]|nr:DoxX family protein [Cytophagales bacterium]